MSRRIEIDGLENTSYLVSDAEYSDIDWGENRDDAVRFTAEDGTEVFCNLSQVAVVIIRSVPPPTPGTFPAWRIHSHGPYGGVDAHVDDANKALVVAALAGDIDQILTFNTVEGQEVKLVTANAHHIVVEPEDLVVPEV